jgi:hypothetical protein
MKKFTLNALGLSFILAAVFSTTAVASAATIPPTPTFYNQSGSVINLGNSGLSSGWYYNQSGQGVYYYGDGTYFNPQTGTYYGLNGSTMSVANPSAGIAAEAAGSVTNTTVTTTTVTPAAPNTGAGGEAGANILALALSGLLAVAGVTYLVKETTLRKARIA